MVGSIFAHMDFGQNLEVMNHRNSNINSSIVLYIQLYIFLFVIQLLGPNAIFKNIQTCKEIKTSQFIHLRRKIKMRVKYTITIESKEIEM